MRVHRTYRAGVAEMASALLVTVAIVTVGQQLLTPDDGEPSNQTAPAVSATILVDYEKAATAVTAGSLNDLRLSDSHADALPWQGWVSLDGKRVEATSDHEAVHVAASRIPDGVAVAVSNPGAGPALLRLHVRMPAGRYTIERLVFGPDGSRIERLQSNALNSAGAIQKPGYLPGGTGAVYRFVDYASAAARAYRRALQHARSYRSVNSRQSAIMVSALREWPWMLTQAQKLLIRDDAVEALKPIHRALLGVRHAQAVCGNTPASGPAARQILDRMSDELLALENALGECSVAALGLLPSATSGTAEGRVSVDVRVRNSGSHTVSAVKLWVTGPHGSSVEPSLQAVFDSLRPGQAAMAAFTATSKGVGATDGEGSAIGPSDLQAHLSYIRDQAPAHVTIAVR
ncbi:MAG: hypothetical protein GX446_14235 [Chthonomonadales bacterium]|nr:hypothetical protein [Chthonomonadales bacterium]